MASAAPSSGASAAVQNQALQAVNNAGLALEAANLSAIRRFAQMPRLQPDVNRTLLVVVKKTAPIGASAVHEPTPSLPIKMKARNVMLNMILSNLNNPDPSLGMRNHLSLVSPARDLFDAVFDHLGRPGTYYCKCTVPFSRFWAVYILWRLLFPDLEISFITPAYARGAPRPTIPTLASNVPLARVGYVSRPINRGGRPSAVLSVRPPPQPPQPRLPAPRSGPSAYQPRASAPVPQTPSSSPWPLVGEGDWSASSRPSALPTPPPPPPPVRPRGPATSASFAADEDDDDDDPSATEDSDDERAPSKSR